MDRDWAPEPFDWRDLLTKPNTDICVPYYCSTIRTYIERFDKMNSLKPTRYELAPPRAPKRTR